MMGKTQKFSKSFVPDYRHAVETVGESDGFGSIGRADSEDSCTPKRKRISSIILGRSNVFNIPSYVISLSSMPVEERKNLVKRLRTEVEQIQLLQKKVLSMSNNGIPISTTSRDGNNMSKKSSAASQLKRDFSGRFESVKRAPIHVSESNEQLLKKCEALLKRLLAHKNAVAFKEPVDPVRLGIPDYFSIISEPMDLGTVMKKLNTGAYSNPCAFASDVRLTFNNAKTYNSADNLYHKMADVLSKLFEARWKTIERSMSAPESMGTRIREAPKPAQQGKKKKIPEIVTPVVSSVNKEVVKKKETEEDRHYVHRVIESLNEELPEHIQAFLGKHTDTGNLTNDEEIEIDIDSLGDDILFQLRKLLDDHCKDLKSSNKKKENQRPVEVLNESGLSNSSMNPSKVNEPIEEDVDIDGNDHPITNYPPVEIEKDIRNSRYSSSSSSSSESSSSSSDSDSASSSENQSETVKDFALTRDVMGPVKFNETQDQEKSDVMNPNDSNINTEFLDEQADLPDQNAQSISLTEGSFADGANQEGENALSEQQVLPEKRIRMALLKNRFADTILKAREKTFSKVENGDPEKLRREKEELERQKRQAKARIQAEAKAAEEVRRQVEVAAAIEAKRKREVDREAARQALMKIEKTVEMNENSQFLKDLELLKSTSHPEQLLTSTIETSPDQSQDCMGGFKFDGSNPLEQLGLYMKDDDEEDDEIEIKSDNNILVPPSVPNPRTD